jgi:hypothetical protein
VEFIELSKTIKVGKNFPKYKINQVHKLDFRKDFLVADHGRSIISAPRNSCMHDLETPHQSDRPPGDLFDGL